MLLELNVPCKMAWLLCTWLQHSICQNISVWNQELLNSPDVFPVCAVFRFLCFSLSWFCIISLISAKWLVEKAMCFAPLNKWPIICQADVEPYSTHLSSTLVSDQFILDIISVKTFFAVSLMMWSVLLCTWHFSVALLQPRCITESVVTFAAFVCLFSVIDNRVFAWLVLNLFIYNLSTVLYSPERQCEWLCSI